LTTHDASVSTYSYSNITTLNKKILSPKHAAACHCVTTARLILERSIALIIRASTLQAGWRISGVTNS
jgi:lipid-binding SYLF domain-containing protein